MADDKKWKAEGEKSGEGKMTVAEGTPPLRKEVVTRCTLLFCSQPARWFIDHSDRFHSLQDWLTQNQPDLEVLNSGEYWAVVSGKVEDHFKLDEDPKYLSYVFALPGWQSLPYKDYRRNLRFLIEKHEDFCRKWRVISGDVVTAAGVILFRRATSTDPARVLMGVKTEGEEQLLTTVGGGTADLKEDSGVVDLAMRELKEELVLEDEDPYLLYIRGRVQQAFDRFAKPRAPPAVGDGRFDFCVFQSWY
jgi:hypothetical protein